MQIHELLTQLAVDRWALSVHVIDRDYRLVFVNEVCQKRWREFGFAVDGAIGQRLGDVVTPLSKKQLALYDEVFRTGELQIEAASFQLADRALSVEVSLFPILADGCVSYIGTVIQDRTEERDLHDALRQSEERYRLHFQASPVPAYVWEKRDDDFVLANYNEAAEYFTRGLIPSFVGTPASVMYQNDPAIQEDMRTCFNNSGIIRREFQYRFQTIPLAAWVQAYYVYVPPNQVVVYAVDLTDRKTAEEELRRAHTELEQRITERTQELAQANEQLTIERETLRRKNEALRELVEQVNESRRQAGMQIQANVERILLPMLEGLDRKLDDSSRGLVSLIRTSLAEITLPVMTSLEKQFRRLTPQEVAICHLIRAGHGSKEIASLRRRSVQTILKQRKAIRRKLGLHGRDVNLATFLSSSLDWPGKQQKGRSQH